MAATYEQERVYVAACLGEEEITRRISALGPEDRRRSIVRWDDNVVRPTGHMVAWAKLAQELKADAIDAYSIYRAKTPQELREHVIEKEHYRRQYIAKDMPENLEDIMAAVAEYHAAQEASAKDDMDAEIRRLAGG